ncbi:unnamed protein product [Caenorhabditis sp. 36 PRJEB53466]|nr:unnamed protein product [Caenorhabditis sp. 36 PRJEB53466]
MDLTWKQKMAEKEKAAKLNKCRDLVEVATGSDWQIRRLMEVFPEYLWKYTDGLTVPAYVLTIAEQLRAEFGDVNDIPTDLLPCEYFRIMKHSMPTELALQPKRFDRAQEQVSEKMQKYYEKNESRLLIPDDQLIPRIACAVRIGEIWYRGKVENVPNCGIWLYVYLVDMGTCRQVTKNDVRRLALHFGHYPPMVIRASVRGAAIQRMDMGKIDKFRELLSDLNYIARCQITTSSEPYLVNICHPTYEFKNMCSFLLTPPHGLPSEEGVWLPKQIARDLERENGVENREADDSGADSEFDDEEEDNEGWNFVEQKYLRSFPPANKVTRLFDNHFQVERIDNERLIYLTNQNMREIRVEIENSLRREEDKLVPLPPAWIAFGTACAVSHEGVLKRAAISGIRGAHLDLLLVDYALNTTSPVSKVFSLPSEEFLCLEPQLTLVSLSAFPFVHFSRVQILRQILPPGTPIVFHRDQKSKEIPTKGAICLTDNVSVDDLVSEQISAKHIDLDCLALVPVQNSAEVLANHVNINFMYSYRCPVIYKKSKLVTSQF